MNWGHPQALHLLWLLVPAGFLLFWLLKRRMTAAAQLVDPAVMTQLIPGWKKPNHGLKLSLWLIGMAFVTITLARPQWGFQWQEVKRRGLDMIVVLDTSRSMLAEDIKPNRLQQAKWGIRDLVGQLKGDRIGLVAFAGSSFLQCPLTIDYAALLLTLDDVYAGIIPRGGTAIEQALRTAMDSFEKESTADKVILLITDGEDHEGKPESLAQELKKLGIRVYSIGIGSSDGELIPVADESGRTAFLKDRSGNVIKSSLKDDVLRSLASETGGAYVRSAPGDSGLDRLFMEHLSHLKRDEQESKMVKAYEDRFAWFLAIGLFFLACEAILGNGRARIGIAKVVVASLFIPFGTGAIGATPQDAMSKGISAFETQAFDDAALRFEEAADGAGEAKLDPAVARYNQGNALFKAGRWDEAATAYADATRTSDMKLQHKAHYNRGSALLSKGKAQAEEQQLKPASQTLAEALSTLENAMALDPGDIDTKVNYEVTREMKKLVEEELKKQESQSQEDKQQDENKEDQKDDQQDKQQGDQESSKDGEKQEQPDQEQQEKPEPDEKEEKAGQSGEGDEKDPREEGAQPTQELQGEMTQEEARLMLDAMRKREQASREQIRLIMGRPVPVEKDW